MLLYRLITTQDTAKTSISQIKLVVNQYKTSGSLCTPYVMQRLEAVGRSVSDISSFVFSSQKEKSTFSSSDEENWNNKPAWRQSEQIVISI